MDPQPADRNKELRVVYQRRVEAAMNWLELMRIKTARELATIPRVPPYTRPVDDSYRIFPVFSEEETDFWSKFRD